MRNAVKGIRGAAAAMGLAILVQGLGTLAAGPLADAGTSPVTATARVHVRSGPSTSSSSLAVLSVGDSLPSKGSSNGWTKVTYKGKTAYVYSQYLKGSSSNSGSVSDSAAKGTRYATANLNLRTGASLRDSVSRVASKGTKLTLTGKVSGNYAQVTYNGKTLWASLSYLSESTPSTGSSLPKVTGQKRGTTALMIRTTSTSGFASLGDAPKGTIFDVTGKTSRGMAQIVWMGAVRWVNAAYLVNVGSKTDAPSAPSTPKTSTQYATTVLNIWKSSTGTSHSGELPRGAVVKVTGTVKDGRAQIVHNGATRWVTARYLSASKPSSGSASSGSGDSLNRGWSSGLDKANANVQAIARDVWDRFPQIKTQYGWRRDVTPDHPAGRAVDVMIPGYKSNQDLGWEIAKYYRVNAKKFNINYIIFGQKIWSVQRNGEGWRSMSDRGGDTANHYDHVHINTYG
ncbi:MAG: SH3 domain-containing protein [Tessaracoccus sp.]|uniref:SH3 domain-containing protein n=1 Tax=Tessaracoccus sp. TaxID=1971211 RepID=UPI001EC47F72|nr:SH3 domain-containing protein [Tessaracoccus sp.]MBK7822876.1 SH3 domain-containing protein [Tessaracoccus sp.]